MKFKILSLVFLCFNLCVVSCKKDDNDIPVIPERDRTEQQEEDKQLLIDYLETHYYNASDFDGTNPNPNPSISDLIITKLEEGESVPEGSRLLVNDTLMKLVTFAETKYEVYYLDLNTNVNPEAPSPTFADNVVVNYEGFTLDNKVFDSAATPVTFDLTSLIPGWRKVVPEFRTAEDFVENEDGTVDFLNHGVGVMFIPSGLAYFSSGTAGIPAYSPIIFKFDLYQMSENDHDEDNVPSYKEDIDGDGELTNDDTDGDRIPDFFDPDDDGDGVNTINEDLDGPDGKGDGDPTNDIGKNGIPKYLDPEETESNLN
ncbi:FKBP-type peptidyl-prolyl cis-trans isomerase [Tamlana fucoidanivorans]|uniref:Peptidyl-prolyl cis-trans isomerase n=1 Tax=Allotamlana fucoidanivorans TaxID=2583814 RepID=A0A5C4SHE0_9FLAO|nr:FKBP-type peptidyl-prolyl cis-trans isomerase [Tamlana fucoidanivorans]TNJ42420.1 hypothetical protein FGF67_14200 [Tamlana fucoidanivorans]